ncbi:MAG: C45 family autoproteolytic acyltransferase/hydrolase [Gemmataceae bacterium]|nr:C45 family autoproteolytic acyltransferase/hydrolase [Gemmataceae bacterium]
MNLTHPNHSLLLAAALTVAVLVPGWFGFAGEPRGQTALPALTTIEGKPRERGRQYGTQFREAIRAFLDREIYQAFIKKPAPREEMLSYAAACARAVRAYAPELHEELEGVAEGSGLTLAELTLLTLHEELYHKGQLPKVEHCTAVAVGPPDTADGNTYVGQTWDWMPSAFSASRACCCGSEPRGRACWPTASPGCGPAPG